MPGLGPSLLSVSYMNLSYPSSDSSYKNQLARITYRAILDIKKLILVDKDLDP